MAKAVKAKWGVGPKEPDDIPDFPSNDEIVRKNGDKHPRGLYRTQIKRIQVVTNSNDDQMLKIFAEINDTDKNRKKYNGYFTVTNQNVTDQGSPYLKKFLASAGLTWADFINKTKMTSGDEPNEITQIGKVKFGDDKTKVLVNASYRKDEYNGEERSIVGRWMPQLEDADEDEDIEDEEEVEDEDVEDVSDEEDDADDEDDSDEEADDDEDDDGEEDEDEDEDDEEEPDEDELREELSELKPADLKERAKEAGATAKQMKGLKKPGLIDLIVSLEITEDDEDEDEEDGEDPEAELREELGDLTLAQLKKRAKKSGATAKQLKTTDAKKLVDVIVGLELAEDEEDGEPPF